MPNRRSHQTMDIIVFKNDSVKLPGRNSCRLQENSVQKKGGENKIQLRVRLSFSSTKFNYHDGIDIGSIRSVSIGWWNNYRPVMILVLLSTSKYIHSLDFSPILKKIS